MSHESTKDEDEGEEEVRDRELNDCQDPFVVYFSRPPNSYTAGFTLSQTGGGCVFVTCPVDALRPFSQTLGGRKCTLPSYDSFF